MHGLFLKLWFKKWPKTPGLVRTSPIMESWFFKSCFFKVKNFQEARKFEVEFITRKIVVCGNSVSQFSQVLHWLFGMISVVSSFSVWVKEDSKHLEYYTLSDEDLKDFRLCILSCYTSIPTWSA